MTLRVYLCGKMLVWQVTWCYWTLQVAETINSNTIALVLRITSRMQYHQ